MKTTAYVRDNKTGEYLEDEHRNHLIVGIDDALKLRDQPKGYRDKTHLSRTYMTRNPSPDKRIELIPKNTKSPHYAFAKGESSTGDRSYDETFSHEAAVDLLSEMTEMNIAANNKKYNFKFDKVFREPCIKLPNGKFFYPDIFCIFNEKDYPEEYKMWGGKLAIEVTNTHKCEGEKLFEFELCNIPVFEFVITDSRRYPPERDKTRKDTFNERLRYVEKLKIWLEDKIWMNIIVNPVSTSHHEKEYEKLVREKFELRDNNKELQQKAAALVEKQRRLDQVKQNHLGKIEELSQQVAQLTQHKRDDKAIINEQKYSIEQLNGALLYEKNKLKLVYMSFSFILGTLLLIFILLYHW